MWCSARPSFIGRRLLPLLLGGIQAACVGSAYNGGEPHELAVMRIVHCALFQSNCSAAIPALQARKRIFERSGPLTGALGGIAGADATCNASTDRPDTTKTYKAFLAAPGVRVPCSTPNCGPGAGPAQHVDWVLQPNTEYYRGDQTTRMFTTNSDAIFTSLENALPGAGSQTWTGIDASWNPSNYCFNVSDWMDNTGGVTGIVGDNDQTTSAFFSSGTAFCNSGTVVLVCVEQ